MNVVSCHKITRAKCLRTELGVQEMEWPGKSLMRPRPTGWPYPMEKGPQSFRAHPASAET